MIIDPSTDLTSLVGRRVVINHGQTAHIHTIQHGSQAVHQVEALHGGVFGSCFYDRHGDDRGGNSAFWWPYGTDLKVSA